MSDVEKSLGAQRPPADSIPSKDELQKPLSEDTDSSQPAEDKLEKEKAGSLKDYFVSGESEHILPDCTNLSTANFPLRRPPRHRLVRDCNYRRSCSWRCSSFNDIGIRLVNIVVQQLFDQPGGRSSVHCPNQSPRSLFCVFVHCPLRHWLRRNSLHMYCGY